MADGRTIKERTALDPVLTPVHQVDPEVDGVHEKHVVREDISTPRLST